MGLMHVEYLKQKKSTQQARLGNILHTEVSIAYGDVSSSSFTRLFPSPDVRADSVVESSGKFCFSCCSSTVEWPSSASFAHGINANPFMIVFPNSNHDTLIEE
jgi:hypothetical protein